MFLQTIYKKTFIIFIKHIKIFDKTSDYQTFKSNEGEYVTPNLCYINELDAIKFNPYIPPPPAMAGDVAYWDDSKVKTTPLSNWSTSLGTPIGVVVVPEGFAPDGKVRIVSLMGVDESGNQSSSHVEIVWGPLTNVGLKNYRIVPTTDNAGSTSIGSRSYGYLPSDKFTGAQSFVDPKAKYCQTSNLIPSPYLGGAPNPEYYKTIDELSAFEGNNVLSDFNGLSNTQTLVSLGSDYGAANAAWKYNDGASTLQWYLPGMGELGYIMPRFNEINTTITALGGLAIDGSNNFWSSSRCGSTYMMDEKKVYSMHTNHGYVCYNQNTNDYYVRPFAVL